MGPEMRDGKYGGRAERRALRCFATAAMWALKVGAESRVTTWCARRVARTDPPKVVPCEPAREEGDGEGDGDGDGDAEE